MADSRSLRGRVTTPTQPRYCILCGCYVAAQNWGKHPEICPRGKERDKAVSP